MHKLIRITNTIKNYIKSKDFDLLAEFLDTIDSHDIADILERLTNDEKKEVLRVLPKERLAEILPEVDDHNDITYELDNLILTEILSLMDDDDATDILQNISAKRREKILKLMEKGDSEGIKQLLQYNEETAGGLMTLNVLTIPPDITVKQAIEKLRKEASNVELIHYLYVTNENKKLLGIVTLAYLLQSKDNKLIRDIMHKDIISVSPDTDQEEVARIVSKYDFLAVPVVSENNKLLGIVTIDDILDVLEEETTEDIYTMAGTSSDEEETHSIIKIAALRFPWLFTNLFGGLLAATIISFFKITISKVITLSFFIPVITGMGGNAGLQTTTTVIRGLSTGEILLSDIKKIFFKEIRIGMIVGSLCGTTVGLFSILWQKNPWLGVIVGISMITAITVAAFIGVIAPFTFKRFNIDPAISAGPFVTTTNDIIGITIYLSIATYAINTFNI